MSIVSELAVVRIPCWNQWWSDTLLKYQLISEPIYFEDDDESSESDCDPSSIQEEIEDEEPSIEFLESHDPTKWKEQDHYAILGLKTKRHRATEEDIRRKYRKMILKHHPDKRENVVDRDNDYFGCITKAFDILGDPLKRKSYDSVDPTFDDDIPSINNRSKKKFFSVFGPVFDRNAHWSVIQPVPLLGKSTSSREEVEEFYRFWYDFDSWREYSYQDEEDKEKGEDRYERRWIEKENRAARLKKKKEEMSRLRQLIDNAYACDPRIAKFKEQDKLMNEERKRKKQEARELQRRQEEDRLKKEEEAVLQAKLVEEEEEKKRRDIERKEKEAMKKQRKQIRKAIESTVESCQFFQSESYNKFQAVLDLEKMFQSFSIEELESFKDKLESSRDNSAKREVFFERVSQINAVSQRNGVTNGLKDVSSVDQNSNVSSSSKKWSVDDCFLLTKAAKVFPPGTQDRWQVITAYFNQHSTTGITRKVKDVMSKSKELQDPSKYLLFMKPMNE